MQYRTWLWALAAVSVLVSMPLTIFGENLNDEAISVVKQRVKQNVLQEGDRWYTSYLFQMGRNRGMLYTEMVMSKSKPLYTVEASEISTAAKLNGREWAGNVIVHGTAYRTYTPFTYGRTSIRKGWGAWRECGDSEMLVFRMTKENGKWSFYRNVFGCSGQIGEPPAPKPSEIPKG